MIGAIAGGIVGSSALGSTLGVANITSNIVPGTGWTKTATGASRAINASDTSRIGRLRSGVEMVDNSPLAKQKDYMDRANAANDLTPDNGTSSQRSWIFRKLQGDIDAYTTERQDGRVKRNQELNLPSWL